MATRRHLVFSHANGFPAPVYRRMFAELEDGFEVSAVARFGHDPRYPAAPGWHGLVAELVEHVRTGVPPGRDVWLAGHSLGGYLSVLAAERLGPRVSGIVLLDSPLISGVAARVVRCGHRTGLDRHLMPLRQTLSRRTQWPDAAAARAHFASKPAFARWDAAVLDDYASAGTVAAADGGRRLLFDSAVEHAIYRGLPTLSVVRAAQRLHCPVAFVGGTRSREVRAIGLRATRRVVGPRLCRIEGGHLFPMERPAETAGLVRALIGAMGDPASVRHAA